MKQTKSDSVIFSTLGGGYTLILQCSFYALREKEAHLVTHCYIDTHVLNLSLRRP